MTNPAPPDAPKRTMSSRWHFLAGAAVVLTIGYFTIFRGYENPPYFFWDENYHVAHAQKYLNGVFFMEPHPPLGKLFIALGEYLIDANPIDNQFIGTDHAKFTPEGFSFRGYRFVPVLLAWLAAINFYAIFYFITGRPFWAVLLSFLYLFDNALIVHNRGAMLEGSQIYFLSAALALFFAMWRRLGRLSPLALKRAWLLSAGFGAALGLALAIKVNALIFLPLFGLMIFRARKSGLARVAGITVAAGISFFVSYSAVWQIHFSLAATPDSRLSNDGWYEASPEYKDILAQGATFSARAFAVMLRDSFAFVPHYQRGVPKLNMCLANENGSPAFLWPIGGRSINYRWERNNERTSYLYLQSNPFIWLSVLAAVLVGAALLIAHGMVRLRQPLRAPLLLGTFLALYLAYLAGMSAASRVLYLYHYFLPLMCGYVILILVTRELRYVGPFRLERKTKELLLAVWAGGIAISYSFFSPLTYAVPMTAAELSKRALFPVWDLRCPTCEHTNMVARPVCDPKVKPMPGITISGVSATQGFQDWGEFRQDSTVEQKAIFIEGKRFYSGIGTHANSRLDFPIQRRFRTFSGIAARPDSQDARRSRVRFQIRGDGMLLWQSPVMERNAKPERFSVDVEGVSILELVVSDGGDGIDHDHAVWLELSLY